MADLRTFCYNASHRVMTGLAQELRISPNVHYRPAGYNASRVLSLRLVGVNPAYLPKVKNLQSQLAMWAGLSDEYSVRIGHDAYSVIVEIPKPKAHWKQVTIEDLEKRHFFRQGAIATLGLGLQGEPMRINFNDKAMAHVFVTGQTRSGKTNTERLIAWNLAKNCSPDVAKMLIFDVVKRGFKWADFGNVANLLHPIITDIETANKVLSWLTQEIDERAEKRYTKPRIFILIDELKALLDDSKVAEGYLSRIASVGGEFGLHLILSTQYSQITMLKSSELKRNVTTRLCGRVDDSQAAVNALGIKDTGAETLGGYGDFLLKDLSGLSRLTVAHIQAEHIATLPRSSIKPLELPDNNMVDTGAKRGRPQAEIKPDEVALSLFQPTGITAMCNTMSIGPSKAKRIKTFADEIRTWALNHGYNCLQQA